MLVKTFGSALYGIHAITITVEVCIDTGINFFMVGLPDNAVKESHQRIDSALRNIGFKIPGKKITINMAPADIRKEGSSYDLTLAVGILAADNIVKKDKLESFMIMGELSLDGSLQPIKGALPIAIEAHRKGFKGILLPKQNAMEAAIVTKLEVYGVEHIREVIGFLNDEIKLDRLVINIKELFGSQQEDCEFDFADVKGQNNITLFI